VRSRGSERVYGGQAAGNDLVGSKRFEQEKGVGKRSGSQVGNFFCNPKRRREAADRRKRASTIDSQDPLTIFILDSVTADLDYSSLSIPDLTAGDRRGKIRSGHVAIKDRFNFFVLDD
jgi:hypothetical protein